MSGGDVDCFVRVEMGVYEGEREPEGVLSHFGRGKRGSEGVLDPSMRKRRGV